MFCLANISLVLGFFHVHVPGQFIVLSLFVVMEDGDRDILNSEGIGFLFIYYKHRVKKTRLKT